MDVKEKVATFSAASQAVCAIVIAILTGFLVLYSRSLNKLQYDLSELQFKQFVMEHTPIIQVFCKDTKPKVDNDVFTMTWKVSNLGGGHAKNVENQMIVLDSASYITDEDRYTRFIKTSVYDEVHPKDTAYLPRIESRNEKDIAWIEVAQNKPNTLCVILRTTYDVKW